MIITCNNHPLGWLCSIVNLSSLLDHSCQLRACYVIFSHPEPMNKKLKDQRGFVDKAVTRRRWSRDGDYFNYLAELRNGAREGLFFVLFFANFLTIKEVLFWASVVQNEQVFKHGCWRVLGCKNYKITLKFCHCGNIYIT